MKTTLQNTKSRQLLATLTTIAATILFAQTAANAAALNGTVKDANGQPVSGAKVRIEARNGGKSVSDVQTDARGHYAYDGLSAGATYRVTLLVNGVVKASINNVLAKPDATSLNFDLKKSTVAAGAGAAAPAKKKHYVWVAATTGTNIGGRWVEVDDAGNADTTNMNNVQRVNSQAIQRMQSNVAGSQGKASGGN